MLYKREGYPEEAEIVFCTVTKIQYHAVTVQLDEYDKPGLIPISEVSPGRIRNIRDFVEEGKKVVCKVIKTDVERGQVDLSLRRVNESQKRQKSDSIKQEQKAEKIIQTLSEKLKKPIEQLYKEIAPKILEKYPYLFLSFIDVVEKNLSLESLGVEPSLAKELESTIKDKIKPVKVEIIEKVSIKTYDGDGLGLIRKAFDLAQGLDPSIKTSYLGGGNYRMLFTAKDYKQAENSVKNVEEQMSRFFERKGQISFERQEA